MKTVAPPGLRYRPPDRWPLYAEWPAYDNPPQHAHKWCRISGKDDSYAVIVCVQCGETQ